MMDVDKSYIIIELKLSYLSISSVTSSKGVHSKTIRPGNPSREGTSETGIEKTASDSQEPEFGTSNFCSNQIAVRSFSGFMQSQAVQFLGISPLLLT